LRLLFREMGRGAGLGCAVAFVGLSPIACGGGSGPASAPASIAATPSPVQLAGPAPADVSGAITEEALRDDVAYLTSDELRGRKAGSGDDALAARYIARELALAGLVPDEAQAGLLQAFPLGDGRVTYNVVAVLPGTDPAVAQELLVVGAHYDHLGVVDGRICPGADDNASGTAVVLEVAKALGAAQLSCRRPIAFAAFGAEELGLIGSRYWSTVRFPSPSRPVCMLNADMVGHLAAGSLRVLGVTPDGPIGGVVRAAGTRHGIGEPQCWPAAGGGSDHVPFQALGVPVAFFHTGVHDGYHTPRDSADTLDYAGLTAVARVLLDTAVAIANGRNVTSLPQASAPPATLDWQRDHGRAPFPRL
jgi:Zn-dependent M28 family amino/carboxypeptidase